VDLATYTDIACCMSKIIFLGWFDLRLILALLDIPVYESRVQSLHALFTLYLGFKNSEVKKYFFKVLFLIIFL
jgi:hypothetical protein